mmetsp:Transcript_8666/g.13333  ORF Transcript_8666/g.13333 Transcript_8666/m.13333 type:complete len:821 (-) Transcript_8666:786-3248(-)
MICYVFFLFIIIETSALGRRKRYVIGVDVGTESVRAALLNIHDGKVIGEAVEKLKTYYPLPGCVEQRPEDWYDSLGKVTKKIVEFAQIKAEAVAAICLATTSCTVVACKSEDGSPVRTAIMWCDARAASEASMTTATKDQALCVGNGAVSAEFFIPKALWIKRNEFDSTWRWASRVCECQDWLNYKLSGVWVVNSCNIATRWHGDAEKAVQSTKKDSLNEWRPIALLRALDLEDLVQKWPTRCVAPGRCIGALSPEASVHLGLTTNTMLVQGGADAFVALIGCGAGVDGGAALITGSSHLQLVCVPTESIQEKKKSPFQTKPIWGPYPGAPLSYLTMAEAGQSSTGSALRFTADILFAGHESMAELDQQASLLPPGSDGLRARISFQGSRTPICDPYARAELSSLSLAHRRPHIWRALIEAIALGTRDNMRNLFHWLSQDKSAVNIPPLPVCGGATRSKFFLQTHANFLNSSVVVQHSNAPMIGAAALAAACLYFREDKSNSKLTDKRHRESLRRLTHNWQLSPSVIDVIEPNHDEAAQLEDLFPSNIQSMDLNLVQVSASLLAADTGFLVNDAKVAHKAGAWLHIDICDGSTFSRFALSSLGPASIKALRQAIPDAYLDVHLAANDPYRHFSALAASGANRVTVQLEAIDDIERLVNAVQHAFILFGCRFGLALAPQTPIESIQRFLDAGLDIDLINILAVEPGTGGQLLQKHVLDKLTLLATRYPHIPFRQIDGGLNPSNARAAVLAGANVLAAGSAIFTTNYQRKNSLSSSVYRETSIANAVLDLQQGGGRPLDFFCSDEKKKIRKGGRGRSDSKKK